MKNQDNYLKEDQDIFDRFNAIGKLSTGGALEEQKKKLVELELEATLRTRKTIKDMDEASSTYSTILIFLGTYPLTTSKPFDEAADVVLDPNRRIVFRAGQRLDLSPKEFATLECLLASGDRVISAEELLNEYGTSSRTPLPPQSKQRFVGSGPSSEIRR